MNKYQEALNELASYYDYDDYPKILQELVDRATPKKPKVISKPYGNLIFEEYRCPVCNAQMGRNDCCSNNECRQAIDWSNELKESTK